MKFVLGWLLAGINTCLRGYLIMTFWSWFVLSQFHNLPQLHLVPAIGLSMFVSVIAPAKLLSPQEIEDQKDREGVWDTLIYSSTVAIISMPLVLFIGWIVHSLM